MSEEITKTLDESSVTAGAKPAEPQGKLGPDGSSLAGIQDLGGPTPFNSNQQTILTSIRLSLVETHKHLPLNHLMLPHRRQNLVTRVM